MQRVNDFLDSLSYQQMRRLGLLLALLPIFPLVLVQTWLAHSVFGDVFSLLGYLLLFASLFVSRRMRERKDKARGIARNPSSWVPWVVGAVLAVIAMYAVILFYLHSELSELKLP